MSHKKKKDPPKKQWSKNWGSRGIVMVNSLEAKASTPIIQKHKKPYMGSN
jgi:hypothetical protein